MSVLRRIAFASVCALVAGIAADRSLAQTPVDPTLLVLRAKALRDVIHDWHHDHRWPPDADYCKKYKDAESILNQLRELRQSGGGGVSIFTIDNAGWELNSELAEEDDINDDYYGYGYSPCNPPPKFPSLHIGGGYGFYGSVEFMANWGKLGIIEEDRSTGQISNQFDRSGKRDGFGFQFGYKLKPWNDPWTVSPFVGFDVFDQTIRQGFSGGTYLGTATNWSLSTGLKVGYDIRPDTNFYGLGAATFLNQKVEINFGGPVTSETRTTPGLTLGLGIEYMPHFLQGYGIPLSVYAQYQHTWYQDVHLDAPAASPSCNYTFQRDDNVFKLGITGYFGGLRP